MTPDGPSWAGGIDPTRIDVTIDADSDHAVGGKSGQWIKVGDAVNRCVEPVSDLLGAGSDSQVAGDLADA
jgi:hypothetical protein